MNTYNKNDGLDQIKNNYDDTCDGLTAIRQNYHGLAQIQPNYDNTCDIRTVTERRTIHLLSLSFVTFFFIMCFGIYCDCEYFVTVYEYCVITYYLIQLTFMAIYISSPAYTHSIFMLYVFACAAFFGSLIIDL
jgi:hypothetical protein